MGPWASGTFLWPVQSTYAIRHIAPICGAAIPTVRGKVGGRVQQVLRQPPRGGAGWADGDGWELEAAVGIAQDLADRHSVLRGADEHVIPARGTAGQGRRSGEYR